MHQRKDEMRAWRPIRVRMGVDPDTEIGSFFGSTVVRHCDDEINERERLSVRVGGRKR